MKVRKLDPAVAAVLSRYRVLQWRMVYAGLRLMELYGVKYDVEIVHRWADWCVRNNLAP